MTNKYPLRVGSIYAHGCTNVAIENAQDDGVRVTFSGAGRMDTFYIAAFNDDGVRPTVTVEPSLQSEQTATLLEWLADAIFFVAEDKIENTTSIEVLYEIAKTDTDLCDKLADFLKSRGRTTLENAYSEASIMRKDRIQEMGE